MQKENSYTEVKNTDESSAIKNKKKRVKYLSRIISNTIFFFLINLYPLWIGYTHGVVTNQWVSVLWAMDITVLTIALGYIILLSYYKKWLRFLIELLISITALISVINFFIIFPLDFSLIGIQWFNTVIRIFLIIGMMGSSIGSIVMLVQFIKQMGKNIIQ